MKTDFVELFLSCTSWQEAQKVADHLLGHKLVACVEFMQVHATEIKLIMESVASNFMTVHSEVAKLHGHDTFALQMVPIHKLSDGAANWRLQVIQ